MNLFDVKKYQVPDPKEVDMRETRKNFETFMSEYGAVREKIGKNRLPKMTQSFSPISATPQREYDGDAERFMIEREMYMPEFKELERIFIQGYYAISNPTRAGGTERRRQIFMLRYIYGVLVSDIEAQTYLGRTAVSEESKLGFIQFCNRTGLLITKEETQNLIETN
ncbi:ArpU family transcriptional regulator [Vagococcus carniphilus]|uniref:ArpU family transcriptional regulator n=1 Tax=Vagococcus carniphilus TaxID=218144 RepID=UPI00288D093E|nr:ArpU family transcriptional regulator [Vagococcus carniphilus]MDT2850166.1 ArpU family transcriptional regulator [Vagococcus carniphilus]